MDAGVHLHRAEDVITLKGEGFQGRPDDMVLIYPPRKAGDRASRIGIPEGRAEPGEGRHHVAAVGIADSGRKVLGIRRLIQDAELVPEPLDRSPRDIDGALQGIVHLPVYPPGDRRQETVFRINRPLPGIHEHEAAGAVSILRLSLQKAGLPEKRRLLISRRAGDRDLSPEKLRLALPVEEARGSRLREKRHGNFQEIAELPVPGESIDVEKKSPGGVGIVRHVDPALCELIDQPGIYRAKAKLPSLRPLSGPLRVV